jgi:hypothetical protein
MQNAKTGLPGPSFFVKAISQHKMIHNCFARPFGDKEKKQPDDAQA